MSDDRPADPAERILIRTKLARPQPPAGQVERGHLLDRLDLITDRKITVISAPAGYGKSTLVGQWLERPTAPASAWLSLDRLDSDLERFVWYVVRALREIEPECLPETGRMLEAHNLPDPQSLAETMVVEMDRLAQPVVLVLDDYSTVRDDTVQQLMTAMVPKLPDRMHVVLLSRLDPPLPIALWRSRDWLAELRGVDLRFSRDEAQAFFDLAQRLELSDEAIEAIHRKTEGWIAGLRLALFSLTESADPEARVRAFSGSERLIVDYLMEQTLASQPPEVLEFLARTAPLERFCAPLCDRLFADRPEAPDSRAMLERLYQGNMFLFPLGTLHGWYRYHHLFRELLLDRFGDLGAGTSREEICRRAGMWFADERWVEEALQYLLEAGDLDAATELFREHLLAVIAADLSRRKLVRWLRMFPPGAERGRLPLLVARLYLKVHELDVDGMVELLGEIDALPGEAEDERRRRWREVLQPDLASLRAFAGFFAGAPAAACEHGARAMRLSPDPRSYQYSLASLYTVTSLALSGRREEALQLVDEGVAATSVDDSAHIGLYQVAHAAIRQYWGELEACHSVGTEILNAPDAFGFPRYFLGHVRLFLGNVAYERDRLDEAESHYREVLALRLDANRMVHHEALVGLGQLALVRGDHAAAERFAVEARTQALETGSRFLLGITEAFERRLDVARGRNLRLTGSLPAAATDFTHWSLYLPSHSWAWWRLHQSSTDARTDALRVIEEALNAAEAHGAEQRAIQLQILRAVALDALDRGEEAVRTLERGLSRGKPLGFVRSFVDRGERVRKMLDEIARRAPEDAYVARLRASFGDAGEQPAVVTAEPVRPRRRQGRATDPLAELTHRELDVLELLQRRWSNKEIATRLGVSDVTVKSHTLRIYRKLGVRGRRGAAEKALGQLGDRPSRF